MYGYKKVYESYYEHQCSAATEKDVIYLDIWGKGVFPRLKRWWHDLFLLSYSDSRSKHYYMSSYAMMTARTAQFRNNRGCIHPFSKFRNIWDCLILHLLLIHMIIFHFNTSIIHQTHVFLHYLLAGIEYIFIMDLFINTRTGYAIKKTRKVIMRSHDILLHYLCTDAFIQVLCAIPLQNFIFLRIGNVADTTKNANLFVPTLKIISTLHIIRLFQVSEYWAKDRDTFKMTMAFRLIRIFVVGMVVIIQIETLTTALSVIRFVILDIRINSDSYLEIMLSFKYIYAVGEDYFFLFVMISRVFKSFFLFGYGLRPNNDIVDQLTAILTYSVAFIFHFWASVVVYHCVVRENSLDDSLSTTWSQTLTVLRHRRLPDMIHTKVKKYFEFKMSHLVVIEKRNRLYRALPLDLKMEMKMSSCRKLVARIPYFAEWPPEVISAIVGLLESEIYLEDDVLSSAWGQPEGLVIVEAGLLAVYLGHEETGHLADGDHFGERTLSPNNVMPSATLIAITPTAILVLDILCFRNMMKQYYPNYLSQWDRNFSSSVNG